MKKMCKNTSSHKVNKSNKKILDPPLNLFFLCSFAILPPGFIKIYPVFFLHTNKPTNQPANRRGLNRSLFGGGNKECIKVIIGTNVIENEVVNQKNKKKNELNMPTFLPILQEGSAVLDFV